MFILLLLLLLLLFFKTNRHVIIINISTSLTYFFFLSLFASSSRGVQIGTPPELQSIAAVRRHFTGHVAASNHSPAWSDVAAVAYSGPVAETEP